MKNKKKYFDKKTIVTFVFSFSIIDIFNIIINNIITIVIIIGVWQNLGFVVYQLWGSSPEHRNDEPLTRQNTGQISRLINLR